MKSRAECPFHMRSRRGERGERGNAAVMNFKAGNGAAEGLDLPVGCHAKRSTAGNAVPGRCARDKFEKRPEFHPVVRFRVHITKDGGETHAVKHPRRLVIRRIGPSYPGAGQHDAAGGEPEERLSRAKQAGQAGKHAAFMEDPHPGLHVTPCHKNEVGLIQDGCGFFKIVSSRRHARQPYRPGSGQLETGGNPFKESGVVIAGDTHIGDRRRLDSGQGKDRFQQGIRTLTPVPVTRQQIKGLG